MKLTTRSEYALLALAHLAREKNGVYLAAQEIAEAQRIPHKYLEQILLLLKGSRLLKSRKGQRGGYRLARPAGDISLAEVIRLMDGALAPTDSVSRYFYEPTPIESEKKLLKVFQELRDFAAEKLEKTKLSHIAVLALALLGSASGARAQNVESLDDRVKILERKMELQEEKGAAKDGEEKKMVRTTVDGGGFVLRSADDQFKLRVGGYLQTDFRGYLNQALKGTPDQILMRRVRPEFLGTMYGWIDFRVLPDFGQGTATLQDAYLDLRFHPEFRARAGKYKEPVGLENLQSDRDILFVERSLVTDLVPSRDPGFMLHGENETLEWAGGVFDGVPDGANADGDSEPRKDGAARIFAHPFEGRLHGLGFGVAGTYGGAHDGGANLPASYKSPAQVAVFSYRPGVGTDGVRARWTPQLYWYAGPAGLMAEYADSQQKLTRTAGGTTTADVIDNRAWETSASWLLTGEQASFGPIKPLHDFKPGTPGWGAWQVKARYSELWTSNAAFPRYADPAVSARRTGEIAGGLNWFLNAAVKIQADYEYAKLSGGNHATENAILTRFQLVF